MERLKMISICIITRNEAEQLNRCLGALAKLDAEIVVVDTGSSDNTIAVAEKYATKICNFEWINDFAAARNYAASCASNDTILMVDTDEYMTEVDWEQIKAWAVNSSQLVGRIVRHNIFHRDGEEQNSTEYVNRLYDRRYFCYEGCIHEQIVRMDGRDYDTQVLPIHFDHMGYDGSEEAVNRKANRNIELLQKMYGENPDDPYIIYQLGKSFYMKKDYEAAFEWFDKATYLDLDERLEYVLDLIVSYGYALINTHRVEQALQLENLSDAFGHSADYRFMLGLAYMNAMQFEQAVDSFIAATKLTNAVMDGVNSYKAYYNIGVIRECLGDTKGALLYYGQCAGYEKALKRIEIIKNGA